MLKVLIPVDGSDNSLRAVEFLISQVPLFKESLALHLLNVQHPFPGTIKGVHEQADKYHREEGAKALARARKLLDNAKISYKHHILVGEPGTTIADFVKDKHIEQVVIGTRGASAIANMLLGSVSTKVMHLVDVPVVLVK